MKRTSQNFQNAFVSAKGGFRQFFVKNKILIILLIFLSLSAIFTGIFTAIKNVDNYSNVWFDNYNLTKFYNSEMGTWDLFFKRFSSFALCALVIFICSFSIFLTPLGVGILVIRSYMIGLNCSYLFMLFGLGGIVTSIIVIIPCQLICIALAIFFLVQMIIRAKNKRKYGCYTVGSEKHQTILFLFFLLGFIVCNIIETFLLYVFSSKIILVI